MNMTSSTSPEMVAWLRDDDSGEQREADEQGWH